MTAARLARALAATPAALDELALAIASLDDEPGDEAAALAALDSWGDQVRTAAGGSRYAGMDALERVLVGAAGFEGDRADYDAPRNSFLPQVIARRRGLPIALAVIYLEVARRAGLPLDGLALPGHFVVSYALGPGQRVVLDPFDRARILTRADLDVRAERAGTSLTAEMLAPASPATIAARMLRNLSASYQRRGRADKVAQVAALFAVLDDRPGRFLN